eukprot:Skav221261  [mRNA]  locus=scaffold174:76120:76905:+ [translate_table: standard]
MDKPAWYQICWTFTNFGIDSIKVEIHLLLQELEFASLSPHGNPDRRPASSWPSARSRTRAWSPGQLAHGDCGGGCFWLCPTCDSAPCRPRSSSRTSKDSRLSSRNSEEVSSGYSFLVGFFKLSWTW